MGSGLNNPLWIQEGTRPAPRNSGVEHAVVQAVRPAAPEFDGLSVDGEACPVRRARDFIGIERGDLRCPCFECGAIDERARLIVRVQGGTWKLVPID